GQRTALRRHAAGAHRADAGRRRGVRRQRIELPARAACARADASSRTCQGAATKPATNHARGDCAAPAVVLGHDVPAHGGAGALAMLHWLGVKPSYSRPRVSDDNAFVESLFRTAKYRPEFPTKGFDDLDEARLWAARFVHWYNHEHRHSGIRYVSPAQRHAGHD